MPSARRTATHAAAALGFSAYSTGLRTISWRMDQEPSTAQVSTQRWHGNLSGQSAARTLAASGTGTFGPVSCSTLAAIGTGSFRASQLHEPHHGWRRWNFGPVSCTSLTMTGGTGNFGPVSCTTLSATSYGSYCTAPLYTTSFANGTQTDIAWGAIAGTSDITHTTNTAAFIFANAGHYLVTVAMMTNTGSSYQLSITLTRSTNSGSTYTSQAVQGTYVSTYCGTCIVYPIVSVSASDYWKLSLYQNGGTQTFSITCGLGGGGASGSIPCSYVNFTRVG